MYDYVKDKILNLFFSNRKKFVCMVCKFIYYFVRFEIFG